MSRSLSSIASRQKIKAFRRSAKIVPDNRGTSHGMTQDGVVIKNTASANRNRMGLAAPV